MGSRLPDFGIPHPESPASGVVDFIEIDRLESHLRHAKAPGKFMLLDCIKETEVCSPRDYCTTRPPLVSFNKVPRDSVPLLSVPPNKEALRGKTGTQYGGTDTIQKRVLPLEVDGWSPCSGTLD